MTADNHAAKQRKNSAERPDEIERGQSGRRIPGLKAPNLLQINRWQQRQRKRRRRGGKRHQDRQQERSGEQRAAIRRGRKERAGKKHRRTPRDQRVEPVDIEISSLAGASKIEHKV